MSQIMDVLAAIVDAMPPALLFIVACTGHTFFLVTALNVLYGWKLPHVVLRITRKADILFVLGGPVLFWYALGFFDGYGLSWEPGHRGYLVTPYAIFCVIVGATVTPVAMVLYWLRRTPAHLVSNHDETVDVAKELGYLPFGHGRKVFNGGLPFNQVFQVEFAERVFQLPRLPKSWDGLTILHLTDLHLCGTPDRAFYQYVVDRCLKWGVPDIVAVTGDVVDSDWHHRWVVPILGRCAGTSPASAFSGNHDSWLDTVAIRRRMRGWASRVLGNRWEQIDVRGEPMIVIGHEGPWFTPAPDLSNCPAGPLRFCLSHTPDNIAWARANKIDLVLAGHVHGGQIRLPLIGSLFVPSR